MSRKNWSHRSRDAKKAEGRRREKQAAANHVRSLKHCITCGAEISVFPHQLAYCYEHKAQAEHAARIIQEHQQRVAAKRKQGGTDLKKKRGFCSKCGKTLSKSAKKRGFVECFPCAQRHAEHPEWLEPLAYQHLRSIQDER